jgi:hypothetical protein
MKIRSGPFTMISLMSGVENQMLDWTEKGQNQLETVGCVARFLLVCAELWGVV